VTKYPVWILHENFPHQNTGENYMQDFRNMIVWEKSHRFVLHIYETTRAFPKEEQYGLKSQILRASSSIPTNIAEGCGRRSMAELAQYLQIAMGSASEVEYQILLAKDLNYITTEKYLKLNREVEEIKKMLSSFIVKLRGSRSPTQR